MVDDQEPFAEMEDDIGGDDGEVFGGGGGFVGPPGAVEIVFPDEEGELIEGVPFPAFNAFPPIDDLVPLDEGPVIVAAPPDHPFRDQAGRDEDAIRELLEGGGQAAEERAQLQQELIEAIEWNVAYRARQEQEPPEAEPRFIGPVREVEPVIEEIID